MCITWKLFCSAQLYSLFHEVTQQCFVIISITTRNFEAKIFCKDKINTDTHILQLSFINFEFAVFVSIVVILADNVTSRPKILCTNTLRDGCWKNARAKK